MDGHAFYDMIRTVSTRGSRGFALRPPDRRRAMRRRVLRHGRIVLPWDVRVRGNLDLHQGWLVSAHRGPGLLHRLGAFLHRPPMLPLRGGRGLLRDKPRPPQDHLLSRRSGAVRPRRRLPGGDEMEGRLRGLLHERHHRLQQLQGAGVGARLERFPSCDGMIGATPSRRLPWTTFPSTA